MSDGYDDEGISVKDSTTILTAYGSAKSGYVDDQELTLKLDFKFCLPDKNVKVERDWNEEYQNCVDRADREGMTKLREDFEEEVRNTVKTIVEEKFLTLNQSLL
jgi:hypothetical protein